MIPCDERRGLVKDPGLGFGSGEGVGRGEGDERWCEGGLPPLPATHLADSHGPGVGGGGGAPPILGRSHASRHGVQAQALLSGTKHTLGTCPLSCARSGKSCLVGGTSPATRAPVGRPRGSRRGRDEPSPNNSFQID